MLAGLVYYLELIEGPVFPLMIKSLENKGAKIKLLNVRKYRMDDLVDEEGIDLLKATCADNASIENFFGILKQEMYYEEKLIIDEALKQEIEEYINFYNNKRIKTKLAGLSPVQ